MNLSLQTGISVDAALGIPVSIEILATCGIGLISTETSAISSN
jgi:hypothetical protein